MNVLKLLDIFQVIRGEVFAITTTTTHSLRRILIIRRIMDVWIPRKLLSLARLPSIMSTTPFVVKHDGKKHNIEHFLRFHPGGTNTLSALRNIDVTDRLFATHHSAAAYELLKDYRVDEEDVHKHLREDGDLEVSDIVITCLHSLNRFCCIFSKKNRWSSSVPSKMVLFMGTLFKLLTQ